MCVDNLGVWIVDNRGILVKGLPLDAEAIRPAPGHARPADPEDAHPRIAPRLGDLEADPVAVERGALGPAGIALPRAPSARDPGLDHRRMEGHRARAKREVLCADARGPAPARTRARILETAVVGGRIAPRTRLAATAL